MTEVRVTTIVDVTSASLVVAEPSSVETAVSMMVGVDVEVRRSDELVGSALNVVDELPLVEKAKMVDEGTLDVAEGALLKLAAPVLGSASVVKVDLAAVEIS